MSSAIDHSQISTVVVPSFTLPERIDDAKKIDVQFSNSGGIEDRIVDYAMEFDNYEMQSAVRAQDYLRTFMRSNALMNRRVKVTESDWCMYDLIHPLFLNSMGELGTENPVLSVLKKNLGIADNELMKKCGLSRGTFYKYKKVLQVKGLV